MRVHDMDEQLLTASGLRSLDEETLVPYEKKKTGPKISIEKTLIS